MVAENRFERVLEDLYKAALGDVEWVLVAAQINDMIGTTGSSLTHVDLCQGADPEIHLSQFFVGTQRREDLEQLYYRDYYRRDEAIPRLHELGDCELAHKSDLYSDQEKKTSAAYNEFRRPNTTENGLFLALDGLDGSAVCCSFGNSNERGGWGSDQVRAIKRLAPHLRQFARVRRTVADAQALGASLAELLENGRSGFIQLDRRGRILEANDRARHILLKRDGLRDERGFLAAETREEDAKLQRLLAQALPPYRAHGAGGLMKITRRKTRAPLALEVHPVRRVGTGHRGWQIGALVLLVDPDARSRVDPELAAAVLGLTPKESVVAVAVAAGQTVAGIADELGCAESTVKTHLKRVYRKQGIHRRTELVRRILALEALRGPVR